MCPNVVECATMQTVPGTVEQYLHRTHSHVPSPRTPATATHQVGGRISPGVRPSASDGNANAEKSEGAAEESMSGLKYRTTTSVILTDQAGSVS